MADPLRPWDYVIRFDGGSSTTDVTSEANNATANDVNLTGAVGHTLTFGLRHLFPELFVNVGTARVGGAVVWEYRNGFGDSDWVSPTDLSDLTSGFSIAGTNRVTFRLPTDMLKAAIPFIGAGDPVYQVRARSTVVASTQALATQAWAILGFPRTVRPQSVTPFRVPGLLVARGQTGKDQLRSVISMGREWDETWGPIRAGDVAVDEFISLVEDFYNRGTVFAIDHLTTRGSGLAPGGVATTNPIARILGGSQTGNLINTDGWTGNQTRILNAGDVIRIDGLSPLYRVVTPAGTFSDGVSKISIAPPIPVGSSPADNATITVLANTLRAYIAAPPNLPPASDSQYIDGLTLTFREAL